MTTIYKDYKLETSRKEGGNSVTTIFNNEGCIVSMVYSSPLDKNDSERKAQIKIDNNFARDHKSLLSELY